jgi:hypothetical protein
MNSEMMKIRPSGSGARERPKYSTTLGCRASLGSTVKVKPDVVHPSLGSHVLHKSPFTFKVFGNIILSRGENLLDGDIDSKIRACRTS